MSKVFGHAYVKKEQHDTSKEESKAIRPICKRLLITLLPNEVLQRKVIIMTENMARWLSG